MSGFEICLVDDSDQDAALVEHAVSTTIARAQVRRFESGEQALNYFDREPARRPDLVLLDLWLPGISGKDVLEHLRARQDLRRIPVVMLATSDDPSDVRDCYAAHATAYIVKPMHANGYTEVVAKLRAWLRASR